jgi:DNA polymerase-3 subunit delta'
VAECLANQRESRIAVKPFHRSSTIQWREVRDMLGQPHLLQRLGERLAHGEAAHAYLISGPRWIGKHTLAVRIGQTLLCAQTPRPGGCGECVACRKIERGWHPDVREIYLLPERREIGIDQIREMERDIALRPMEGRWRVVIIDDAGDLSLAAQDSLLKTLEEPPSHAVLVLVARAPRAMKPTIASRCQPVWLRTVPTQRLEHFLAARSGSAETARQIAPLASGRPGLALRLASDTRARQARLSALDDLFMLVGRGLVHRFGWANRMADERESVRERFAIWLELLRDSALAKTSSRRLHPDRADRTARLGDLMGRGELADLAGLLIRLHDDLDRNSNVRTALELFCLRLPYHRDFEAAA